MSDETLPASPSARGDKQEPPEEPARFGRYRVTAPLGEGGMGTVFAAFDEALDREVAVKSIRLPRGASADGRAMLIERFEREGRVLASLSHPHVVRVHDVGHQDGLPFLVMERVRGPSLSDRVRRGPLPVSEAAPLGAQLAAALEAAHRAGILHRDLKPANVLYGEGGWVLADFGVARLPRSQLTMVGQFLGTPAYAAPEALSDGAFSEASDMYGWGATLFHALVGRAPYGERDVGTVIEAQAAGPPALPAGVLRALPGPLASAVRGCLDRDPRARPTARQVRERLAGVGARTRVGALAGAGCGLFALGLLVGLLVGLPLGGGGPSEATAAPLPAPGAGAPLVPPAPRGSREDYYRRWDAIAEAVNRGDHEGGRRQLEELLARYPDDGPALELLDRLDAYEVAEPGW